MKVGIYLIQNDAIEPFNVENSDSENQNWSKNQKVQAKSSKKSKPKVDTSIRAVTRSQKRKKLEAPNQDSSVSLKHCRSFIGR